MGILDRLGNVLKSYINDGVDSLRNESFKKNDEDYNAAYEELEDFLHGEKPHAFDQDKAGAKTPNKGTRTIPPELRADFQELGLQTHATEKECKEAYKKLLKIHHPDRFGKDPEKMKKATEKTSRINMAYERLEKWFIGTSKNLG